MAADSTLVSAAFKEAESRAGADVPNLKPLYEAQTKTTKSYLDIAVNALTEYKLEKETLKIGKDQQLKDFKTILNSNYEKLFQQNEPMPQEIVSAVDIEVRRLQDDFEAVNTYGEGDTVENERARMKINADLQKVINQAINARKLFGELGDPKLTSMWHDNAIDQSTIAPMALMMDLDNLDKDDNVSVSFVDGKLTFRALNYDSVDDGTGVMVPSGDMSYNLEQMRENVPFKDAELHTRTLNIYQTYESQGINDAKMSDRPNINEQTLNTELLDLIATEEEFTQLALTRVEGVNGEALISSLEGGTSSVSLELMGATFLATYGYLDKDNDDDIDMLDMGDLQGVEAEIFKKNFDEMIDVLTNTRNNDFDINLSRKLLAKHLAEEISTRYEINFENNLAVAVSGAKDKNGVANRRIGRNGRLFNPATQNPNGEYVGWRLNKMGDVLYDDMAVKNNISKGEGFNDPYNNRYIPVFENDEFIGYNVIDGSSGATIIQDWDPNGDGYMKSLFYNPEQAYRNAVGDGGASEIDW